MTCHGAVLISDNSFRAPGCAAGLVDPVKRSTTASTWVKGSPGVLLCASFFDPRLLAAATVLGEMNIAASLIHGLQNGCPTAFVNGSARASNRRDGATDLRADHVAWCDSHRTSPSVSSPAAP